MVQDEVIANQPEALLTGEIISQENYYRQLGLQDRMWLTRLGNFTSKREYEQKIESRKINLSDDTCIL